MFKIYPTITILAVFVVRRYYSCPNGSIRSLTESLNDCDTVRVKTAMRVKNQREKMTLG